ncbi:MAG: preprotein translocase subunit SecA [Anaerolineae bacterium]|nr:preprotein translocase subunit SecA [Anaerolineae bacterium]
MLQKVLKVVFGDPNERELVRHREVVAEINALEEKFQRLTDDELRAKTAEFKTRLAQDEALDDLLPEAFAAVREAARRTIRLRHYDVQLIGGIVLHQGKIAEMKTGEGKTLVATLALYLNALMGRGAHLVTPNDYLSKFGVQWMGPVYHRLGMTVGVIQNQGADPTKASFVFDPAYNSDDEHYQNLFPVTRRAAYEADITYGTNNEFGFDYLRDNMARDKSQYVQRELYYAIVDEVDNILIDEARTPLIISGPAEPPSPYYRLFARIVKKLKPSSEQSVELEDPDGDYVFDEKMRNVTLTKAGIEKVEAELRREPEIDQRVRAFLESKQDDPTYNEDDGYIFAEEFLELTPYLDNALRANVAYKLDRDYIVDEGGQVIIVDEFTGRLMHGRRYSEGLHQSIEAKEGVEIRRENLTLATITFQNFFRMYDKLAGMTGTAATEREEFEKTYNLDVTIIPTHEPVIREDKEDLVFFNESVKFKAAVAEIKRLHEAGRPVLVGTASIDTSERLARLLERARVPHQVLNAKQHEREAGIIAQAGRSGAVTIATNMAGRGVDILLGGNPEGMARQKLRQQGLEITEATPEQWQAALKEAEAECAEDRRRVLAQGGLHVLGTERHEARRIDNQLRGRSGRQGDPGSSQFYLSFEDDLMRRFGGERIKGYMNTVSRMSGGELDEMPITHSWVSKTIEQAQKRVEGYNFDIRKRVLEYDDVVNKQREVIYAQRREVLEAVDLRDRVMRMIEAELTGLAEAFLSAEEPDLDGLHYAAANIFPLPSDITAEAWENMAPAEITEQIVGAARQVYEEREARFNADQPPAGGEPFMRHLERWVLLQMVDRLWVQHLTDLDVLREGIGLMAYGNRDPLVEYKREAHAMWEQLLEQIQEQFVKTVYRVEPRPVPAPQPQRQMRAYRPEVTAATAAAATPADGGSRRAQQPAPPPEPVRADKWDNVGRNDPCPCGSGKKFKHCHYRIIQQERRTVKQEQVKRGASSRQRRRK